MQQVDCHALSEALRARACLGCAANPAAGVELQSKRGPGGANAISLVLAVLATGGTAGAASDAAFIG
jgi:hypothetical protein